MSYLKLSPVTLAILLMASGSCCYPVRAAEYKKPAPAVIEIDGVLQGGREQMHHVSSFVRGRVVDVFEDVGARVVEQQPLLTVKSPEIEELEAELLQNLAGIKDNDTEASAQLAAQIKQQEEDAKLSQDNYLRLQSLLADKIAARASYESAKTEYDKDQIELASLKLKQANLAKNSIEQMRLKADPIKQRLQLLGVSNQAITKLIATKHIDPLVIITANARGEIVQKSIMEGEIVDPEKTLFLIRDSQSLVINGFVPAAVADKIHSGSSVEVVLPGETKRRLSGGISYISDKAIAGKYAVRARINSGGAKLKPGTTLRMRISL